MFIASSPGPNQILSRSRGEKSEKAWDQNYVTTGNGGLSDFSPRLRDKIWVEAGDEAKVFMLLLLGGYTEP